VVAVLAPTSRPTAGRCQPIGDDDGRSYGVQTTRTIQPPHEPSVCDPTTAGRREARRDPPSPAGDLSPAGAHATRPRLATAGRDGTHNHDPDPQPRHRLGPSSPPTPTPSGPTPAGQTPQRRSGAANRHERAPPCPRPPAACGGPGARAGSSLPAAPTAVRPSRLLLAQLLALAGAIHFVGSVRSPLGARGPAHRPPSASQRAHEQRPPLSWRLQPTSQVGSAIGRRRAGPQGGQWPGQANSWSSRWQHSAAGYPCFRDETAGTPCCVRRAAAERTAATAKGRLLGRLRGALLAMIGEAAKVGPCRRGEGAP
jgi:hypothetical protein